MFYKEKFGGPTAAGEKLQDVLQLLEMKHNKNQKNKGKKKRGFQRKVCKVRTRGNQKQYFTKNSDFRLYIERGEEEREREHDNT